MKANTDLVCLFVFVAHNTRVVAVCQTVVVVVVCTLATIFTRRKLVEAVLLWLAHLLVRFCFVFCYPILIDSAQLT